MKKKKNAHELVDLR